MRTYPGLIIGTKNIQTSNANNEHWQKRNVHGTICHNGQPIKLPETGINLWLNDQEELWADPEAIIPLLGSLATFHRHRRKYGATKLERHRNPTQKTKKSRTEHYELNSILDLITKTETR